MHLQQKKKNVVLSPKFRVFKSDVIGWFRSEKLELAIVERKNERGGDQELRERSRARMRKRNRKILGI